LIIDEKKGRKIARQLNIKIIGILGIIIKAKDRGVLKEAKPYFLKLREKGFRYSKDLEMKMLKRVGE
jgi:predicted nucleic acid-binding protein